MILLYIELESPQTTVANKTSLNLQMEEIEKLRISSSHDSEVIKYQRDATAQLIYMVPERKLYVSFTINRTSKHSIILEERSIKTTDKTSQTEEFQNALENNEVRLEELLILRERIRELEATIQEMKQLVETRKTSSLVLQNSSDIIPLSGYNNYILIS